MARKYRKLSYPPPFSWWSRLPRASKFAGILFICILVATPLLVIRQRHRNSRDRTAAPADEFDRELARALDWGRYESLVSVLPLALERPAEHSSNSESPPPISRALTQILTRIPEVEVTARLPNPVTFLASSANDDLFVAITESSTEEHLAYIIKATDGTILAAQALTDPIHKVSFSPNSQHVALGLEHQLLLLDTTTDAPAQSIDCQPHILYGCLFGLLSGTELVKVQNDQSGSTIVRLDWKSGDTISSFGVDGFVQSLAVNPSGQIFSACTEDSLMVLPADMNGSVKHPCGACGDAALRQPIAFLPTRGLVATTCENSVCTFSITQSGDSRTCISIDSEIRYGFTLHPLVDGSLLLAPSSRAPAMRFYAERDRSPTPIEWPQLLQNFNRVPPISPTGLALSHLGDSVVNTLTSEISRNIYPKVTAAAWVRGGEAYLGARGGDILTIGVRHAAARLLSHENDFANTQQADATRAIAATAALCPEHWATLTSSGDIMVQSLPLGALVGVFPKPVGAEIPRTISCSASGEYLLARGPTGETTMWPLAWARWVQRACEIWLASPANETSLTPGVCDTPNAR